jgi:hypothetical protein
MPDPIEYVYPSQPIRNGAARVGAPKGLGVEAVTGVSAGNYEINDYASALPTTGTIVTQYGPRFTGCPPCLTP